MCGIVGVTSCNKAAQKIYEGLLALEYRGYDSAGIYVKGNEVQKTLKRVESLLIKTKELKGDTGIGHTRWATHGEVSLANAHPHRSYDGSIYLVHNGVIKNYLELKEQLLEKGITFYSSTDTEVLVNLIAYHFKINGDIDTTLKQVFELVQGELAVAFTIYDQDGIYFMKRGSPLSIIKDNNSYYLSSDPLVFKKKKGLFYFPNDEECGHLGKESYLIINDKRIKIPFTFMSFPLLVDSKGHYKHYMKKEIMDEIYLLDRIKKATQKEGFKEIKNKIKTKKKIALVGCGSSYYALSYICASKKNLDLQAYVGSEFIPKNEDLFIIVSQSGETYDLIQAVKKIRASSKADILLLTNATYSSLARYSDDVIFLEAGMEKAVAATKTYISSLLFLDLLFKESIDDDYFLKVEEAIQQAISSEDKIKRLAKKISDKSSVFFIGRDVDYYLALEGSLKLKEISYIHGEALRAGELKHGPIAVLNADTPVIALSSNKMNLQDLEANIKEVKARKVPTYHLSIRAENADLLVKEGPEGLSGIGLVVLMQLLSYHTANLLKRDIDKPRNLAKSVTVV